MDLPVVVIVRDPDHSNNITIYPEHSVVVIDLDLGGSIDRQMHNSAEDMRDWVDSCREQITLLPDDHPAREHVESTIEYVLETFDYGELEDEQEV